MNTLLDICKEHSFDTSNIKTVSLQDGSLLYSLSIEDFNHQKAESFYEKYKPIFRGGSKTIQEWTIWVFEKPFNFVELWETDENRFQAHHIVDFRLPKIFMIQRINTGVPIGFAVTLLREGCARLEVNRYEPPTHVN